MQFVRHARAPELPVILLEDAGALLGLAFALLGVGLTLLTSDAIYDGIATLGIGLLLVTIAVILATEIKSLLVGEVARPRTWRRSTPRSWPPREWNASSTCAPCT